MALTSDNKYIISGSSDKSIKIFDLSTFKEIRHVKDAHESRFVEWPESYYLAFLETIVVTSDNKYVISGSGDKSIKVFEFNTGKEICHFKDAHKSK